MSVACEAAGNHIPIALRAISWQVETTGHGNRGSEVGGVTEPDVGKRVV